MKIVAVTACQEGLAYTYIAAEALKKAAYSLGVDLIIESLDILGKKITLTDHEIKSADGIIVAADYEIDLARFAEKQVILTTTAEAIANAKGIFLEIMNPIIN